MKLLLDNMEVSEDVDRNTMGHPDTDVDSDGEANEATNAHNADDISPQEFQPMSLWNVASHQLCETYKGDIAKVKEVYAYVSLCYQKKLFTGEF